LRPEQVLAFINHGSQQKFIEDAAYMATLYTADVSVLHGQKDFDQFIRLFRLKPSPYTNPIQVTLFGRKILIIQAGNLRVRNFLARRTDSLGIAEKEQ
jgi:hypothetical protein